MPPVRDTQQALAAIGLGSNLGDRERHLQAALDGLVKAGGIELVATSTFISTKPLGPPGQCDYLNAVCLVRTTRRPLALLGLLRRIEARRGRDRVHGERWGPRTLDLDLLLYDGEVIHHPQPPLQLHVPHPGLIHRRFVLEPLCEIAPDLVVPPLNKTVSQLLSELMENEDRSGVSP